MKYNVVKVMKTRAFHFWFLVIGLAVILCGKMAVEYYTYRDVTPRCISVDVMSNGNPIYTYEIAARYSGNGKFVTGDGSIYYAQSNYDKGVVYTLTVSDNGSADDISDDNVCKIRKKHFQYCGDEK